MTRLVLASGNPHKATEVAAILGDAWEVVARAADVDETGATFEENASLKAHAVVSDLPVVGEDSGIVIDALGGRPGIHSARWTEEDDWIPRVLRELDGVDDDHRTARYVAAAVLVRAGVDDVVVRGVVEGRISRSPRGVGGFGYDPIFVPDDAGGRTFAELPPRVKHDLSHRGRAIRALLPHLGLPRVG